MADVRSLLKAKRQEARITHPYATYTPSDQLKCSICATIIKHASAWEGHLGSKAHRTAVARVRQAELEAAAAAASLEDKESTPTPPPSGPQGGATVKRKASVSEHDADAKKRRTASPPSKAGGFPADFFSDPTRQIPVADDEDEDEEDGDGDAMAVDSNQARSSGAKSAVDEEYERFQRELLMMQEAAPPVVAKQELYARATIAGEEELFTEEQQSGFQGLVGGEEEATTTKPEEETEEQKRQRDHELIMDRLMEEERLQEDADMRVASMKARMEALKKKREMRKAQKGAS